MKKLLALATTVLLSGGVFAQSDYDSDFNSGPSYGSGWGSGSSGMGTGQGASSNTRHMIEFNADSVFGGVLNLGRSKTRGKSANTDTNLELRLNYAYSIPSLPQLQVGGRFNYFKQDAVAGRGDAEDYGVQAGAIWNFMPDLSNSVYASLYFGFGWANTYGGRQGDTKRRDELTNSTLSLGKRFSLDRWGIDHLVYSPELALQTENSTTGGSIEYRQDFQVRFLQFSVLF